MMTTRVVQPVLAAVRRRFPRFFRVAVFRVLAAVRLASSARAVHETSRSARPETSRSPPFLSMTHPIMVCVTGVCLL